MGAAGLHPDPGRAPRPILSARVSSLVHDPGGGTGQGWFRSSVTVGDGLVCGLFDGQRSGRRPRRYPRAGADGAGVRPRLAATLGRSHFLGSRAGPRWLDEPGRRELVDFDPLDGPRMTVVDDRALDEMLCGGKLDAIMTARWRRSLRVRPGGSSMTRKRPRSRWGDPDHARHRHAASAPRRRPGTGARSHGRVRRGQAVLGAADTRPHREPCARPDGRRAGARRVIGVRGRPVSVRRDAGPGDAGGALLHCAEQGVTPQVADVEELFAPVTPSYCGSRSSSGTRAPRSATSTPPSRRLACPLPEL